jgi:uncharacterized membrane protein YqiK
MEVDSPLFVIGTSAVLVALGVFFALGALRAWVRNVGPHQALVVSGTRGSRVRFGRALVLPMLHKSEVIDLRTQRLELDLTGQASVRCRDRLRVYIEACVFIRVNPTAEDILKVAQCVGCERATDPGTLEGLFGAKLIEAVRTVAANVEAEAILSALDRFKDEVIMVVGTDLNGYHLEDLSIGQVTAAPREIYDPGDPSDAEALRRITEAARNEQLRTLEIQHETDRAVAEQNLRAAEQMAELDRARHRAEIRAELEVRLMRHRMEAELAEAGVAVSRAAAELEATESTVAEARATAAAQRQEDEREVAAMSAEQRSAYDTAIARARSEYEKALAEAEARAKSRARRDAGGNE